MPIRVRARPSGPQARVARRHGEPLTFGVPLPKAFAREDAQFCLTTAGGRPRAVQSRALDRWSDGSVRWLLVDAQADVDPQLDAVLDLTAPSSAPETPPGRLNVLEDAGGVQVDTGKTRFVIRPGGRFPFESVESGHAPLLEDAGLFVTNAQGAVARASLDRVELEESGPLRAVVRLSGTALTGVGRALYVTARLHFYAGLPTVRVLLTLTNPERAQHPGGFWDLGDPGSVLFRDASLLLRLAGSGDLALQYTAEPGAPWEDAAQPFELYQDSSGGEHWQSTNHLNREHRVPVTFRGYRVRAGNRSADGLRATPSVMLSHADRSVGVCVPAFWQNFPKAIEVTGTSLAVRVFPGQFGDLHELQGGEQRTHECFLTFGPDPVTAAPLEWCRDRSIVSVDPEWCRRSGAVRLLAPLEPEHAALVQSAVEGPDRFELKREVIDQYGWRHFGELYGDHEAVRQKDPPLVSHYNNQYDTIGGFALQFLRTGDERWWRAMNEMASHVTDIDVYHTNRDKWAYNHGLFWHTYHYGDADTATHRSYPRAGQGHIHGGGPSAGHLYTTGLMLHYFLTGDAASREVVIGLAGFVIDSDDGRKSRFRFLAPGPTGEATASAPGYFGPGRAAANSFNALMDGFRLSRDLRFWRKLETMLRQVIHPGDDLAERRLDVPEQRWFYTMFLQSLGRYLEDKRERGQLDESYEYGRASLLHYARWMAEHEHPYLERPDKLEFPTETWAAQDIRKSDVFYFAALHSSGEERARFAERGAFFHRYSVSTLQQMPTRALARPVVVLLTSGHAGAALADRLSHAPEDPLPARDFGRPSPFVPQRTRAMRNAMVLAAGAALLVLGAGIWWFTR